ncbi:MAG: dienelactone hydrolase family protein [Dehalococcoidia bacterium]|jgi:carboxymethylenebutenolidase|nr:dienelactone hydrolase family protein [Dehalococcoidia bacterium]
MCFPYHAKPPILPIAGAAIDSEDLTLTASDGNQFAAYVARAEEPLGPAIVVLPDVRGLFPFYEELALRFAERGYDAVAFDYFGRTAGIGKRDAEFEFRPHIEQSTFEGVKNDVAACVAYLRADDPNRKIFTIGFCFGGSGSWQQAANGHGLSGAIGFYGHPTRENFPGGSPAVVSLVEQFECPVLALMGGADQGIPADVVEEYEQVLTDDRHPHEVCVYEGAPHSFFDRGFEEYAAESKDAWERVLRFIEQYS